MRYDRLAYSKLAVVVSGIVANPFRLNHKDGISYAKQICTVADWCMAPAAEQCSPAAIKPPILVGNSSKGTAMSVQNPVATPAADAASAAFAPLFGVGRAQRWFRPIFQRPIVLEPPHRSASHPVHRERDLRARLSQQLAHPSRQHRRWQNFAVHRWPRLVPGVEQRGAAADAGHRGVHPCRCKALARRRPRQLDEPRGLRGAGHRLFQRMAGAGERRRLQRPGLTPSRGGTRGLFPPAPWENAL